MKFINTLFMTVLIGTGFNNNVSAQQLRDTVRRVDPSVVVIKTVEKNALRAPQPIFVSSPGLGSGVLISADGNVLTAAHVVQAADKIEVEFIDGQLAPAKVIASVPSADVALVKLDWVPSNAVIAKIGDSDQMQISDEVFVIGAPYGIGHSVSFGHISARRKPKSNVSTAINMEMLQTDAAINKGNSGGPVFNKVGEVVGIVSLILSQSGGFEGLGFAITSNLAKRLLIDRQGFWSGIDGVLLSEEWTRIFNIPQSAGLLVQRIADNSPASRIGLIGGSHQAEIAGADLLVGGDIILSVGAFPVTADGSNMMKILDYLSSLKSGEPVMLKVLRAGRVEELKTTAIASR